MKSIGEMKARHEFRGQLLGLGFWLVNRAVHGFHKHCKGSMRASCYREGSCYRRAIVTLKVHVPK